MSGGASCALVGRCTAYRLRFEPREPRKRVEKLLFEGKQYFNDELQCDSLAECNRIKDEMKQVIDEYGFVTVDDLYNIAGLNKTGHSYDYFNRGWADLSCTEIISLKDCYVLKLPNPMFIC